jgi:hypothetical protein
MRREVLISYHLMTSLCSFGTLNFPLLAQYSPLQSIYGIQWHASLCYTLRLSLLHSQWNSSYTVQWTSLRVPR